MRGKGDQDRRKSKNSSANFGEYLHPTSPPRSSTLRRGFLDSPGYPAHDRSSSTSSPNSGRYLPVPQEHGPTFKAVVQPEGIITLYLRNNCWVDIAPNDAVRVVNNSRQISMALSGCAKQMALVHPMGRILQYESKIEVQTEYKYNVKNAKMWHKGISFTDTNCSLVYLVDQGGTRSTHDQFYDLYAATISDTLFFKSFYHSYPFGFNMDEVVMKSCLNLENAEYWRTEEQHSINNIKNYDCWRINDITIKQTDDGFVSVEREHYGELFILKTSPNNGKARIESSFMYATASIGLESHMFVKSFDRRLHYNGEAFILRKAGHTAGFDEAGGLRLW